MTAIFSGSLNKYLEDRLKSKREDIQNKSFMSQTTKEKSSTEDESSQSENQQTKLKFLIKTAPQENEFIEDIIQKNEKEKLGKFIQRKINLRLNQSLKNQQQETIEQAQQQLEQFNQNLNQIPISIIKKLISEQENKKEFLFNLMTRIEQLDFAKNEIFIDIINQLQLENKKSIQTQLKQINFTLERKYTNQVNNYLEKLQPMIQIAYNQENFFKLVKKQRQKETK